MMLDNSRSIVNVFDRVDKALYSTSQPSGISDLGDRIEWVGVGRPMESGEISSESIFYGLLTSLVYLNQT